MDEEFTKRDKRDIKNFNCKIGAYMEEDVQNARECSWDAIERFVDKIKPHIPSANGIMQILSELPEEPSMSTITLAHQLLRYINLDIKNHAEEQIRRKFFATYVMREFFARQKEDKRERRRKQQEEADEKETLETTMTSSCNI